VKKLNDTDKSRRSDLFLGSEPLEDVLRRTASKDDDKGDDDGMDSDKVDSDQVDKGDRGDDARDSDGKD
jgi:hypothetical protein